MSSKIGSVPPNLFYYLKHTDKSKLSSDHSFRDELHPDIVVGVTVVDQWQNDFQNFVQKRTTVMEKMHHPDLHPL